MSGLQQHIANVQSKVQQILRQYLALKKQVQEQASQIEVLKKENEALIVFAEELKEKNLLLRASVSDLGSADKKEMEQRINKYIKNIDKCIALLSR